MEDGLHKVHPGAKRGQHVMPIKRSGPEQRPPVQPGDEIIQLERQLQEVKRTKGPFDPSSHHTRSRLRTAYEKLLLDRTADPATSAEACEDVLQGLWRLHYKHIEEFRSSIRRLISDASAARGQGTSNAAGAQSVGPHAANAARHKTPLHQQQQQQRGLSGSPISDPVAAAAKSTYGDTPQVISAFLSFLSEVSGFYHELMGKLKAKQGLPYDYTFVEDAADDESSSSQQEEVKAKPGNPKEPNAVRDGKSKSISGRKLCRIVCQRCLIYLGDLARYREQAGNSKSVKDWTVACSYYQQAAAMVPWSGNPHNQLAVLATYVDDEFLALYHYCRSLTLSIPFPTAQDNLTLAFKMNLKKYPAALALGKAEGKAEEKTPEEKRAVAVKRLLTHMVRINGIINTKASLSPFGEVYLEAMKALAELLETKDEGLLAALAPTHKLQTTPPNSRASEAPSAAVAVRIMAVLIYTLSCLQDEAKGTGTQGSTPEPSTGVKKTVSFASSTYSQVLQRTMLTRHAVLAIFEFAGRIIQRCCSTEGATSFSAETPNPGQAPETLLRFIANPLFPAVAIFLQWLAVNPALLIFVPPSQSQDQTGPKDPSSASSAGASSQAVDREQSARLYLWGQCRVLLNLLLDWSPLVPAFAWTGVNWVEDREYLPQCYFSALVSAEAEEGRQGGAVGVKREVGVGYPALWEDLELRGFTPLVGVYQVAKGGVSVDMGHGVRKSEGVREMWSRVERMVRAGVVVCANQPREGAAAPPAQGPLKILQFEPTQRRFFIGLKPPAQVIPPLSLVPGNPHQGALPAAPLPGAMAPSPIVGGYSFLPAEMRAQGGSSVLAGVMSSQMPGLLLSQMTNGTHVNESMPSFAPAVGPATAEVGAMANKEMEEAEEEEGVPAWAEGEGVGGEARVQDRDMAMVEKDFLEMSVRAQQEERERKAKAEAGGVGSVAAGGVSADRGFVQQTKGATADEEEEEEEDEVILFKPGASAQGPAAAAQPSQPVTSQMTHAGRTLAPLQGPPHAVDPVASSHSLFSSPSLFSSLAPGPERAGLVPGSGGVGDGMAHLGTPGSNRKAPIGAGVIGQQRGATGAGVPGSMSPGMGLSMPANQGLSGAQAPAPGLPEFLNQDRNFTQFLQSQVGGGAPSGQGASRPGMEPSFNTWLGAVGVQQQQQHHQHQQHQQVLVGPSPFSNPFDQFTHAPPAAPHPNSFFPQNLGPPGGVPQHLLSQGGQFGGAPGLNFQSQGGFAGTPQGVPNPAHVELLKQLLALQQQQQQQQQQQGQRQRQGEGYQQQMPGVQGQGPGQSGS